MRLVGQRRVGKQLERGEEDRTRGVGRLVSEEHGLVPGIHGEHACAERRVEEVVRPDLHPSAEDLLERTLGDASSRIRGAASDSQLDRRLEVAAEAKIRERRHNDDGDPRPRERGRQLAHVDEALGIQ